MKKLAQITLIVITLFAINSQLSNAQLSSDETSKVDRFLNSEFYDALLSSKSVINDSDIFYAHSLEHVADHKSIKSDDKSVLKLRKNKNILKSDLAVVDDEESQQVESWMLNPCDWLCSE